MRNGINPANGGVPDFEGMSEEEMYNYFVSFLRIKYLSLDGIGQKTT